MNRYVAGFLFYQSPVGNRHVLLVEKTRPNWQLGLWNGIGGKIEEGERLDEAMRREFREETGLPHPTWHHFAKEMKPDDYSVDFFRAEIPYEFNRSEIERVRGGVNDVGERLLWHVAESIGQGRPMVGNLRWLIPLAMDWRPGIYASVQVDEDIKERPTW